MTTQSPGMFLAVLETSIRNSTPLTYDENEMGNTRVLCSMPWCSRTRGSSAVCAAPHGVWSDRLHVRSASRYMTNPPPPFLLDTNANEDICPIGLTNHGSNRFAIFGNLRITSCVDKQFRFLVRFRGTEVNVTAQVKQRLKGSWNLMPVM